MIYPLIWPSDEEYPVIERTSSSYNPLHSFDLAKGDQKHYQQQYGDMYFLRLAKLKPAVEELAEEAWGNLEVCINQAGFSALNKILSMADSRRKCTACRPSP